MSDRESTHSDGCWMWHHGCAARKVADLEVLLREAEEALSDGIANATDDRYAKVSLSHAAALASRIDYLLNKTRTPTE